MNKYRRLDSWADHHFIKLWPRTKSAIEWGNAHTRTGLRRGENIAAIAILLALLELAALLGLIIWRVVA